jgi:hypothetical protein
MTSLQSMLSETFPGIYIRSEAEFGCVSVYNIRGQRLLRIDDLEILLRRRMELLFQDIDPMFGGWDANGAPCEYAEESA